jgi:uridine kinase
VKQASELLDLVSSRTAKCGKTKVITIDGPAGAGKTTLAKSIADQYQGALVIHMDDLYRGWDSTLGPLLTNQLTRILTGVEDGSLEFQKFDWSSNTLLSPECHASPEYLFLEGVGSGQREITKWVALALWIEVPTELGLARVIARDGEQVAQPMSEFMEQQKNYFAQDGTRERADYRLSGLSSN